MIFTLNDSIAYDRLTAVWTFSEQREVFLPLPVEMAQIEEFGNWIRRKNILSSARTIYVG